MIADHGLQDQPSVQWLQDHRADNDETALEHAHHFFETFRRTRAELEGGRARFVCFVPLAADVGATGQFSESYMAPSGQCSVLIGLLTKCNGKNK